jgi:hypothetical protein
LAWSNAIGDDDEKHNHDISREYKELLQEYKSELEHFEKSRKKEIVLELAKKLLEADLTFDMTKQQLIDDLRGYIHKTYIQRVIEQYYSQTRDSLQDDDKNVIEQEEEQDATKSKEMTAVVTIATDSSTPAVPIISSGDDEEKAKNTKRDIKTLVESNDYLLKRTQELEAMNLELSTQLQDKIAAPEEKAEQEEEKNKSFHSRINEEEEKSENDEGYLTASSNKIIVKELIIKHNDDYQILQIQKEELEKELENLRSTWESESYLEYQGKRIPLIVAVFPETKQVEVHIDESKARKERFLY